MTPAISRYNRSRFWAVHDAAGELVCVCVYKRGALEVARRLALLPDSSVPYLRETPPETGRKPVRERS